MPNRVVRTATIASLAALAGGCEVEALSSPDSGAATPDAVAASPDAAALADSSPTAIPVRGLPGLESIIFWERTGGIAPWSYEFAVDGPELGAYLPQLLTGANDIAGAASEFYDVYYSDADGNFEIDGAYLTISGVFENQAPAGGGLNLAEIELVFASGREYAAILGSYAALGDNANPALVGNCIDGDLQTHTYMGNTVGASERLRITLGFESTVIID